jgi:hypothetical protein
MKRALLLMLIGVLAVGGCASSSSTTNPESAQAKCKGTWDSRTNTCIGG